MLRRQTAYVAAIVLMLASFVLAGARGASHDVGTDMVICSGAEMITITIGPDGEPIEKSEPCPDGTSIFAASFALPVVPQPDARLLVHVEAPASTPLTEHQALSPSARGPPALA